MGIFELYSRSGARNSTVGPLLSGHPRDFKKWPLIRGWPFNRGIEYCSLEILK